MVVLTGNDGSDGGDDLHFSETERDSSKVTNPSDISTFLFPAYNTTLYQASLFTESCFTDLGINNGQLLS